MQIDLSLPVSHTLFVVFRKHGDARLHVLSTPRATVLAQPHLHSGLGIRRLRRNYFECRVSLQIRLVFRADRGVLLFLTAGDLRSRCVKFLKIDLTVIRSIAPRVLDSILSVLKSITYTAARENLAATINRVCEDNAPVIDHAQPRSVCGDALACRIRIARGDRPPVAVSGKCEAAVCTPFRFDSSAAKCDSKENQSRRVKSSVYASGRRADYLVPGRRLIRRSAQRIRQLIKDVHRAIRIAGLANPSHSSTRCTRLLGRRQRSMSSTARWFISCFRDGDLCDRATALSLSDA